MGDNTKIEWADATVNFWHGCKKVSQGCKFCYMFRDKTRYNQDPTEVVRAANATFYKALKWEEPRRIFTCSWSDFFIKDADAWRADAWEVIKKTPQHTWLILTKRPDRILQCLPSDWGKGGYKNVWLGVSIESEKNLHRIMELFEVPCQLRFLSVEPLLGPVALAPYLTLHLPDRSVVNPIGWVILGGESGNETGDWRYRTAKKEWFTEIIGKCKQHGVPVFMKQLGTGLAKELKLKDRIGADFLDPRMPANFKIREFPPIITEQ